ncbi:short transient receptor potential channel 6-like [Ptychodera flava]|uniref:short transient receptor potential channel 6-like n=1 Tax=Ptychodera flava TaxID=63121 RepID=UPI003969C8A2
MSTSNGIHMIFSEDYLKLANHVENFTVKLLELCKDEETVLSLLKNPSESKTRYWDKGDWNILRKSIDKEQKMFIADSKTQHVIHSAWIDGQPLWSENSGICWKLTYAMFLLIMCGAFQPILALIHVFIPCSPLSRFIKSPKTKFTMHMFSYAMFLNLLVIKEVLISQPVQVFSPEEQFLLLILLYIWTAGLLLGEVQQLFCQGAAKYFSDLWNMIDIAVLGLVVATIILKNVSIFAFYSIFPILVTFALLRTMHFFYLHEKLGPMLLSFTRMARDVFIFICLSLIVVFSFAMSFYVLHSVHIRAVTNAYFSTFYTGVATLLWTMFGKDAMDQMDVYVSDLSYANLTNGSYPSNTSVPVLPKPIMTATSYILYCVFCFLTLLILLNLCIAMMSDTFTKIQDNVDIEWKFVKSKIIMDFISGPVLSSPFNVIPTFELLRSCIKLIKGETSKMSSVNNIQLIRMLVLRYINGHMLGQKKYHRPAKDQSDHISSDITETCI